MIITYYGASFFKIQFADTVIAYNPISKDSKFKSSRFGADIAMVSFDHEDFNGVDNLSYKDREPFVILGPGEYEVKDVFIKGFGTPSIYRGEEKFNTIYSVSLEGINLCFLGVLRSKEIDNEIREALGAVDILFVPVGGESLLSAEDSYKLSLSLDPQVIIPVALSGDIKDAAVSRFLKEEGSEKTKPIDKLSIKKKDLIEKEGEIVIINPSV